MTICTQNREKLFREIVGATLSGRPNNPDKIVTKWLLKLANKFKDIKIDEYIVMPNHVHLLITIDDDNPENRYERAIRESPLQSRSTLSKVVGYLKMNISKEIHKINPQINVWQRSYYEHNIRN